MHRIDQQGNEHDWTQKTPSFLALMSESTERSDRTEKLQAYQKIPRLKNYLLVAQDARRVEFYRRTGLTWRYESFVDEGEIALDCPAGVLTLAQMYDGVVA